MGPVRWRLAVVATALVLVACAPTRAAAPPEPELVGVSSPPTTAVRTTTTEVRATTSTSAPPTTNAIGSADPYDEGRPDPPVASESVSTSTTSTVAPYVAPEPVVLTGWAAFDQVLRLEFLGRGDPSASAAVMIGGDVVHTEAFGVRVPGTFERVEPNHRFRVASISKVVTAIVVLRLVEAGLLTLEDPVGARLATALGVVPNDPQIAAITTEQLLSHTSGMPVYQGVFFGNGAPNCPEAARRGLTGSVAPPGHYRYSNMNYCLLGLLVEQVTGTPYEQAAYEWLLTPLGITGMRLAATYDAGPDEVLHQSVPGRSYMESLGAAGAWIATASDVARIVGSLSPANPGWRPLSDDTLARMRRSPVAVPPAGNGYGLGLILYPDGSFGHTGTLEQTHAMVVSRPDGVTWAVLVNGEYPSESSRLRGIVDRAFGAAFPG